MKEDWRAKAGFLVSAIAVTVLLLVVVLNIVPVATSTTDILVTIVLVIQVVSLISGLALGLLPVEVVHALGLSQSVHLITTTHSSLSKVHHGHGCMMSEVYNTGQGTVADSTA